MGIRGKITKAVWCLKNMHKVADAIRNAYLHDAEYEGDIALINASRYWDEDWYRRNNIDLQRDDLGMSLAEHYLRFGGFLRNDPSRAFSSEEYYALNSDVQQSKMNPLVHYEMFGRYQAREVSLFDVKAPSFPEGAIECDRTFDKAPADKRRTVVMSSYFGNGKVPETLLYLLNGLKEVADNIILIADCKVIPEELEKLNGYVCYAKFIRHEQYDFGSYKRGLEYAEENGLLDPAICDELVMMNDSSYGPVYPFSESFDRMTAEDCDFWGYTTNKVPNMDDHISSYFIVFKRKVIDSGYLGEFLSRVKGKYDRGTVVARLETKLTSFLVERGLTYKLFCEGEDVHCYDRPLTLLTKYRVPFVKVKAFTRKPMEDLNEVVRVIEQNAPDLAKYIEVKPFRERDHYWPTMKEYRASFSKRCERIAGKVRNGEKIKVLFFIINTSMFPAQSLFKAMLEDELFDPYLAISPDLRWQANTDQDIKEEIWETVEKNEKELIELGYEKERILRATVDEIGRWNDLCDGMDIVCYTTPYMLSSFRYNHRYAVENDFLPIMVNYGFYRSKYDSKVLALDTYQYMWKAFFECDETVNQYVEASENKGANAELTGYIKMDELADYPRNDSGRKKILIALHHSVSGGSNEILALGNFERYSDYFKRLPDRYPQVDFIYRPHPFLIKTLSDPNHWGTLAVTRYIDSLKRKPNVIWSDNGNYLKEFASSDACIQDCGSYLVEYFYTKNPCCYMLKDPGDINLKFAPLGKQCLENCYISYDTQAIDRFIEDVVIGENDPKKEARETFADQIMVNYPHAADAALTAIKKEILGE